MTEDWWTSRKRIDTEQYRAMVRTRYRRFLRRRGLPVEIISEERDIPTIRLIVAALVKGAGR